MPQRQLPSQLLIGCTMNHTTSVGEAVVRTLEENGIEMSFGIPGMHTLELYRGLSNSRIRHVVPRHEQACAFMADGYARASGKPAACFIITGAGLTNAGTGIAQATADSSPMLVISSVGSTSDLSMQRARLHELKAQSAMMAPLVAWSHTLLSGSNLPIVVARAFGTFSANRPQPVHIEIPLDVLKEEYKAELNIPRKVPIGAPNPDAIDQAVELLRAAQSPVIIVGGGARHAADEVTELAERLGAPVVSTVAGSGILPDSHPLCLGATLPMQQTCDLIAGSDLALVVGTQLAECDHWKPRIPLDGKIVRVDIDEAMLTGDYGGDVLLKCDAQLALRALLDAGFKCSDGHRRDVEARVRHLRDAIHESIVDERPAHMKIIEGIRQALPNNGILVGDMTQVAYTANMMFPAYLPRTIIHPSGYGTLGFALPAAIGACLADVGRPVVALIGDGGLQFTIQELATAADLGLPLPIVLYNNQAYAEIRDGMRRNAIAEIGVDLQNPDFQKLANSYGCGYQRPRTVADLVSAIEDALKGSSPTVIEVCDGIE